MNGSETMASLRGVDWLLSIRGLSSSITTTVRTMFVFAIAMALTYFFTLTELDSARIKLAALPPSDQESLLKFQNVYEGMFSKNDDYLEDVEFWKDSAFWVDIQLMLMEPCMDSAGINNPTFQNTLRQVTALANLLSYHYGRLNRLHGRYNGGFSFDQLPRDQLNDLLHVVRDKYAGDDQFKEQIDLTRKGSVLVIKLAEKVGVCGAPDKELNPKLIETLKKTFDYQDYQDLSTYLLLQDIRTFGNGWPEDDDTEFFEKLIEDLEHPNLFAVGQERQRLQGKISELEQRQAFSIPIIGVSVPSSLLGLASLLVNGYLLLAYFSQRRKLVSLARNQFTVQNIDSKQIRDQIAQSYWAAITNSHVKKLHVLLVILLPTLVAFAISLEPLTFGNSTQILTLMGFALLAVLAAGELFRPVVIEEAYEGEQGEV